ncbi:MAG: GNAT family N-acetyltransferase [Okeania sp. SIO2G4]|uniref:GNAT family N-acetyltransferase n=1 Tax=unclassified Okeania TaxID=2634635 RepID=UPI0013BE7325|nr:MULTISPECIES: GNAT family N-acetyltransferase [unclassified Okeania]NEP05264.1 GNAT family N-acetyltransferase [Okeania sp. SIO4D6]NEP38813.1 GNAT family N-acetyltransferase [Okeania sp. SIO2H7]NEP75547.1 GNAT family N-acetyltransferase [Okeania sp. SIO2G5]NEP96683.1 GNAT family N-acetyltransferase [Okeania sp. SIO2F5]NEQ94393.1 GNAT family N-acetyltransferase [Okeania sp. SIO2G4]
MQEFQIRLIQNQQEKDAMYYQRWLVLRAPINMEIGTEKDEYEDSALHIIAVYKQKIIGSARLREMSKELGSIAYLCVLSEFQSQGIGTSITKKIIEIAKEKQLKHLRVMTRLSASKFYKRIGFIETGEPFQFLGIPHQFMYFNLLFYEDNLQALSQ